MVVLCRSGPLTALGRFTRVGGRGRAGTLVVMGCAWTLLVMTCAWTLVIGRAWTLLEEHTVEVEGKGAEEAGTSAEPPESEMFRLANWLRVSISDKLKGLPNPPALPPCISRPLGRSLEMPLSGRLGVDMPFRPVEKPLLLMLLVDPLL